MVEYRDAMKIVAEKEVAYYEAKTNAEQAKAKYEAAKSAYEKSLEVSPTATAQTTGVTAGGTNHSSVAKSAAEKASGTNTGVELGLFGAELMMGLSALGLTIAGKKRRNK